MKQFSNNVAIKQSKMLAYRNPSNEDSDNIFRYTLKLNAYVNTDIFEAYIEQFRIPGEFEVMAKKFIPDLAGMYR